MHITSVFLGSFLLHLLLAHCANPQSACFWKLLLIWKPRIFLHSFSSPFPAYSKAFPCFQHLLTGGQRVCEAGNLSAHRSRLLEVFFTHQQDLACVVLHSMVWKKVVTASWPSWPSRNAAYAELRWGCSFLGKCPNPNWACRSEGHLLKAHAEWSLTTETEGTTLGLPAGSSKKGGKEDSGREERHKLKVPPCDRRIITRKQQHQGKSLSKLSNTTELAISYSAYSNHHVIGIFKSVAKFPNTGRFPVLLENEF